MSDHDSIRPDDDGIQIIDPGDGILRHLLALVSMPDDDDLTVPDDPGNN
jgi:hypothetical protein